MHLKIRRQKKHVYETAYAGVRLRPGLTEVTEPAAIAALLGDRHFQVDRKAGLFEVEESGIPTDPAELEALKGPGVVDFLKPDENNPTGTFPDIIPATATAEAEVLATESATATVAAVPEITHPAVIFALYRLDKRATVRKAIAAQLEKIYGKPLTEAEILAVSEEKK